MKKFVSMAMVAAMTTSMVPATAFAASGEVSATAKIVDAWEKNKDFHGEVKGAKVPELQLKITEASYKGTTDEPHEVEVVINLDNALLDEEFVANPEKYIGVRPGDDGDAEAADDAVAAVEKAKADLEAAEEKLANASKKVAAAMKVQEAAVEAETLAKEAETDAKEAAEDAADAVKDAAAALEEAVEAAMETAATKDEAAKDAKEKYEEAQKAYDDALILPKKAAKDLEDAKAAQKAAEEAYLADLENAELKEAWEAANTALEDAQAAKDASDVKYTEDAVAALKKAAEDKADAYTEATKTAVEKDEDVIAANEALENAVTDKEVADKAVADAGKAVEEASKKVAEAKAAVTEAEEADAATIAPLKEAVEKAEKELEKAEAAVDAAPGQFEITEIKIDGQDIRSRKGVEDADELSFTMTRKFQVGDVIFVDLVTEMDKHSVGKNATVSVEGDLVEADDLVFVSVLGYGITAETKKLANVAEEEFTKLEKDLKIKSVVENFVKDQVIELKLSNGFEFTKATGGFGDGYSLKRVDEDTAELTITADGYDEIQIAADQIEIEATSAKSGDIATLKVKATSDPAGFKASTSVEVMKVVDYTVMMTVEEDEDVPVIYSGVNVANYGITDDSDHLSLEVTVEESFPGAWSMRKGFNFELPDGVYVTDMEVISAENFEVDGDEDVDNVDAWEDAFEAAYREADHKGFEFAKRTFDDVDTDLSDDVASMTFQLELVADPGFVGDVNLKFTGDLVDEQEVTIAKFATPYFVKAEQNDLKIDYRYTEVPTEVVITEAEPGLWDKDEATFKLIMEHGTDENFFAFEDATVEVDSASGMEIKSKVNDGNISVTMEDESDDEVATITVKDIELFMSRSIPAGPYDLEAETSMGTHYMAEKLFAPDVDEDGNIVSGEHENPHDCDDCDEEYYVACVADFSTTVKEAFVNVVTAGREQDDASFTTKVVVPVGESYIVAGEQQVTLDVPAYVSAAGYTMLPVRAVATALGINNNNVIWNGESKTVTILYGQRIITMVAGQKIVNVNGSAIPASAAVEIVDGRTFLPMRDLATALGVTDITWDAATKTATLNGGVVAE